MPRERIAFQPNVPVTVALKYPVGKIVSGQYGEQVYYTTSDDKAMYLDLAVGQQVNELQPKPGEPIVITKAWSGKRDERATWKVERAAPRLPLPDPGDKLQEQLHASVLSAQARKAGEQSDGTFAVPALTPQSPAKAPARAQQASSVPSSLIEDTNALVDAYAEVLRRTLDKHEGRIKPDECRSLLLSVYIQRGKAGSYAA